MVRWSALRYWGLCARLGISWATSYIQCFRKGFQLRTWSSWMMRTKLLMKWYSFYTKGLLFPILPIYDISQDLKVCYSAIKWRNMVISTSTLLHMHLLGNGMCCNFVLILLSNLLTYGIPIEPWKSLTTQSQCCFVSSRQERGGSWVLPWLPLPLPSTHPLSLSTSQFALPPNTFTF